MIEPLNPVTAGHEGEGEKPGCNLIVSAGAAATQTVGHLHVHVVPRREGDGLLLPWSEKIASPIQTTKETQ